MNKRILIGGASGLIGSYISKRFESEGYIVNQIGRGQSLNWQSSEPLIAALEESDIVINLAGKSVNCRHTAKNRKEILASRVDTTDILNSCLLKCKNPPRVWFNASGTAIYPRSIEEVYTEYSNVGDTIFMAKVCEAWEAALFANELPSTRRIAMRTGVVLAKEGGALAELIKVAKIGLGGKVASGEQMMSWIAIEDYYRILKFAIEQDQIEGALNFCAPQPLSNKDFMKTLRTALDIGFGIPTPKFALAIGAFLMGTEASLVLDSYHVVSQKLQEAGFEFDFPELKDFSRMIV